MRNWVERYIMCKKEKKKSKRSTVAMFREEGDNHKSMVMLTESNIEI